VRFVDLTGYTRLTEEQGDEAAAELAGRLAALVEGISVAMAAGRSAGWATAACSCSASPTPQ
jgi:class 3 adenylate cyclase